MGYDKLGRRDEERQAPLVKFNRKWWFSTTRGCVGADTLCPPPLTLLWS